MYFLQHETNFEKGDGREARSGLTNAWAFPLSRAGRVAEGYIAKRAWSSSSTTISEGCKTFIRLYMEDMWYAKSF